MDLTDILVMQRSTFPETSCPEVEYLFIVTCFNPFKLIGRLCFSVTADYVTGEI